MKLIAYPLLSLLLLLVSGHSLPAQDNQPLKKEWLARDIEALTILPKLTPLENQTFEGIQEILGLHKYRDEDDLGFGARTFSFSKGNGYTNLIFTGFVFNGKIGSYRIAVYSTSSWPRIRQFIIEAWKQNSELRFEEGDYGMSFSRESPEMFQTYKNAVSAELGEMESLTVPADLRDSYESLISPLNNSVVGKGCCGYACVIPQGKRAIDEIVKANRIDLIGNILKGYNPGGRVYAAQAMLELEKQGVVLSIDAQNAIKKIRNLDISIETCSGCIHYHKTAKDILDSPEDFQ